jgi:hypothetical protein
VTMTASETTANPRPRWFWPAWGAAFLGFPIGGAAATLLAGPVETVGTAAMAGAIAGGVIGAAQWLVLRRRLPLSALWAPLTAAGMALGMALGGLLLGDDTSPLPLLMRGVVAGSVIGLAQATLLWRVLPSPAIWAAAVAVGWPVAWTVSASVVGIDLTQKWAVFGSSGALTFQLVTGLALAYVLRRGARAVDDRAGRLARDGETGRRATDGTPAPEARSAA